MGLIRMFKNRLAVSVQKDRQRVADILARQAERIPDERAVEQAVMEFNSRQLPPNIVVLPETADERLKREIDWALSMSDADYRKLYDRHTVDMSMTDRDPFTLSNLS